MDNTQQSREEIVHVLQGGHAHDTFDDVIGNFPVAHINDKAPNVNYSFYGLLEHIRRTQQDILEYIISSNYREKNWPNDYWPDQEYKASENDWNQSVHNYKKDLEQLITIAKKKDLFAKVANGATILKELLIVADHSSYHIGEFGILRQVAKIWPKTHDK